jgi:hypothetical protein
VVIEKLKVDADVQIKSNKLIKLIVYVLIL